MHERVEQNPDWAFKVPYIPVVMDLTKAPEWIDFMFIQNSYYPFFVTPISSVQATIGTKLIPLLDEAVGYDDDGIVKAINSDDEVVNIPVKQTELPQAVIEYRDLSQYGHDMAIYAGKIDTRSLDWAIVDNAMHLVRMVDNQGNIIVRCYVAQGMANGSNSFSMQLTQTLAFAYSDNIHELVSPITLDDKRIPTVMVGDIEIGILFPRPIIDHTDIEEYFDLPY